MQSKSTLYWQLLHNQAQLTALYQSYAIPDFVQKVAFYLQWPDLTFDQMLNFLEQQNRTKLEPELELFSRFWQPAEYRKKEQAINWVPAFEPLQQPFYQDDMLKQRGKLLAQLIRPATLVSSLLEQAALLDPISPNMIIFHWSRCGSTLLGGLYRQLTGVKLLSESMLISDLLLDSFWPERMKPQLLKLAVQLQGRFRHGETQLVLKLNAWDLQQWPLWLQQFPEAKVLCLGREPAAILTSHQRMSGMHMAGLHGQLGVFGDIWRNCASFFNGRCEVLYILMQSSEALIRETQAAFIDYQYLIQLTPEQLSAWLGRTPDSNELQRWKNFSTRDAKQPALAFQQGSSLHDLAFSPEQQQQIQLRLQPLYQLLLQKSEL
jgi:hypothetical protein